MAEGLTESERAALAELDAQRPPPPLDSVEAVRSRLPAPWEVADAGEWADRIRRQMRWPTTTTAPEAAAEAAAGGEAEGLS